jgi:hypothetical protein
MLDQYTQSAAVEQKNKNKIFFYFCARLWRRRVHCERAQSMHCENF